MATEYNVPSKIENPLVLRSIANEAVKSLLNYASISNVKTLDASNNPYTIAGSETALAQPEFISQLNTPVYSNVIFNAGKILDNDLIEIDNWADFRIDDILLTVTQSKRIITTEIQGKDGSIKEYIGLDDYQVTLVGRLNGAYNINPIDETKTLKKILAAGQPIAITNWWLQNLGITDLVVKDFSFPQTEGGYSTQFFNILAISDNPVEVLVTNQ